MQKRILCENEQDTWDCRVLCEMALMIAVNVHY